ncbi:MAG: hypothetical protein AAF587_24760 [Bacteroidota bacterium]
MRFFRIIFLFILGTACCAPTLFSQDLQSKTGFYFAPEYSAMFLQNHVGNAIGFNLGTTLLQRKLAIGFRYVGRSGPINEHAEFPLVLPAGTTYKGKQSIQLGADHAYFGLELAYQHISKDGRWIWKIPASFGQVGAGFYLKNEDRITPDGRRVSEWEDQLMGDTDAGFGLAAEIGSYLYVKPVQDLPLAIGGGIHYTRTFGYESFVGGSDFYNNKLRASFGIMIYN